jgi:hypothetical protein
MPPSRNDIRNDIQAPTACPACANAFTPTRRQRYRTPTSGGGPNTTTAS